MISRTIGLVGAAYLLGVCAAMAGGPAQPHSERLSLQQAEQLALRNHPAVQASEYSALAGAEAVREAKAAYFPTVVANLTGAQAQDGSRIAAGGLNNPIILDRFAGGVSFSQMITDFGRTGDLVASASLRAEAQEQQSNLTRADVLLQVDRAYFSALRALAVQRVAEETVEARQLMADQVQALAASSLKSGLDVSFANVSLAEAKLLLVQAQNDVLSSYAMLSAAIGRPQTTAYDLADEPLPSSPPEDSGPLIAQALRDRPDAMSARFARESAAKFADAQRALWMPTLSLVGAAGMTPYHQTGLNNQYSAIGLNISVPVTNGNLYSALRAEAKLRASAEEERSRDVENQIARDVQMAWLSARTAYQRLDLTNQLLTQASDALELAQARYNLGLSSIVELTQAQLNKTQAEIGQATARYEYHTRAVALSFETGALRR